MRMENLSISVCICNGVKVVSARETITEGSNCILLEAVLAGYAEYFSVDIA